ncbi:hypothetical protein FHS52_000722 [Erythromicrobium ramosum]|uniref:Uncharacterized protein n=1 Tax=Erythrobacter ramosus TaxID=35811 RepID=A0A6I4UJU3_9SPHN|nr:hypothetical protein [Erythrobacter ramosus]MBB3774779.1 hypothetical protein [Erythrobacter ramosus]MXP37579.1 hypothetical protein [Erythrobacter ramosus]
MGRAMRVGTAAVTYWAIVFALGFVLGTVRVLWVIPMVGLMPATLLELPIILTASWLASGWILRRFAIATRREALTLGLLAFAILMAAECALAGVLSGQTPAQWLAGLRQPHALLGLAGQVAFALMPWWRVRRGA